MQMGNSNLSTSNQSGGSSWAVQSQAGNSNVASINQSGGTFNGAMQMQNNNK